MNAEEKQKKLKLMRYWLFGIFVIIFAAFTVYIGGVLGLGLLIMQERNYWLAIIATAVLCVAAYYLYKWYLGRKA
jgi:uncharacterized membrane protein YqjE